ncbi:hypothetical protein [Catenulispora rubra]|uniref:hypothetical protein n=1 Tax=Catenulispora rubra TaxID=280293 RepID=UPI001892414A|nr:hypothetical protein [Catenulispora rubra]
MSAAGERLWRPEPPVPLARLTVWTTRGGAPVVVRDPEVGTGIYVVASTLASIDLADAPGGARPVAPGAADAVLALVPEHHGLVVDKASADPVVVSAATVDQLRPRPIPYGTESDAAFHLPPPHVTAYLAGIRRAARPAGAGRITAAWTLFPDSVPALLLIVKPARKADGSAALDAVYRAVQELAPPEAVRVIDAGTLSRGQMFRTLSGQRLVESPAPDPDPYAWPAGGAGSGRGAGGTRGRWGTGQGSGARGGGAGRGAGGAGSAGGPGSTGGTGLGPRGRRPGFDPAAGRRQINGRTPFNLALAMVGALTGAFVTAVPREFSMHGAAAGIVVAVGVLIIVACVGGALRDFFRKEP